MGFLAQLNQPLCDLVINLVASMNKKKNNKARNSIKFLDGIVLFTRVSRLLNSN